jgi:3-oxoacyl-[acyl-carrier-protein] synthase II
MTNRFNINDDQSFDRRLHKRFTLSLKAQLTIEEDEKESVRLPVNIIDISLNDVAFQTSVALRKQKIYPLDMYIDSKCFASVTVKIERIATTSQAKFIAGGTFIDFKENAIERIHALLEQRIPINSQMDVLDRRSSTKKHQLPVPEKDRIVGRRSVDRDWLQKSQLHQFYKTLAHHLEKRVVVTGLGVVSPIGIGRESFSANLKAGISGIRPITQFDCSEFSCKAAGYVLPEEIENYVIQREARRFDRSTLMALIATRLALQDSRLDLEALNRRKIGIAAGSSAGGTGWVFQQYERMKQKGVNDIHPYTIAAGSPNACSGEIAATLSLKGPCASFSQGCASAASAIEFGLNQIQKGRAITMIVGGTEAPLSYPLYAAFDQSGILAAGRTIPKPFDQGRSGIVLGEGAAFLILEDREFAIARKANIYAELLGVYTTCDGYHMVVPDPSAEEPARAATTLLHELGINSNDIDVVFAHAPGTKQVDTVEIRMLRKIFSRTKKSKPVTNVKALIGYTQGACIAMEAVAASLAIYEDFIPGIISFGQGDDGWLDVVSKTRYQKVDTALVNCIGFGGKNACILFRSTDHQ